MIPARGNQVAVVTLLALFQGWGWLVTPRGTVILRMPADTRFKWFGPDHDSVFLAP